MSTDVTFVFNGQRYRFSKVERGFVFASKLGPDGKASRGRPSKLNLDDVKALLPESVLSGEAPVTNVPTETNTEPVNSFPDDTAPVNVVPESNQPPVTDLPVTDDGFVVID